MSDEPYQPDTPQHMRDRIAAVQARHHHWDYAGALTCACGEDFGLADAGWEVAVQEWAKHVTDAVIEALGLREERTETETVTNEQGATWFRQGGYRYVTDWIDNG